MDEFLARLGIQAMNYAMRCGIALTSTFALKQCSRFLKTVEDESQHSELHELQKILDSKIKIISPALDLIEFKSGRGNVFLGNAAVLAKALHRDIVALGKRLETAAAAEELAQEQHGLPVSTKDQRHVEVVNIIRDIRNLLTRIEGDIPLLQLAITASGENLSTSLPTSVSPSRLLQASMFLVVGDTQYSSNPNQAVQIGPSFTLSLYMLFLGHSTSRSHATGEKPYGIGDSERKPIWQEVLHKARVRICRTPPGWQFFCGVGYKPTQSPSVAHEGEYAYHLEIIEDFDDGRVHEDENSSAAYDSIPRAGVQESIPIHQISKLFYTDSGRILNIGAESDFENTSVLLLKRDIMATVPTKAMAHMTPGREEQCNEQDAIDRQLQEESKGIDHHAAECGNDSGYQDDDRRFPRHLDPEWIALEVFAEEGSALPSQYDTDEDSDDERDEARGPLSEVHHNTSIRGPSADSHLVEQMRNITVSSATPHTRDASEAVDFYNISQTIPQPRAPQSPFGSVMSSLSLLEMLIRLTSLQEFQQTSHLSIPDHILTFFLEETSTTGLRGEARWKVKRAAEQRVGFDPFTDTPKK